MAIKYKWIASELTELIKNGKFHDGKLPTEAKLMEKYHVSRQTIRQALTLLTDNGLITSIQGSGTFLTGLSDSQDHNQIAILLPQLQEYIFPQLYNELSTALSASGFHTEAYQTSNEPAVERQILTSFLQNPPKGILLMGSKTALPSPNLDLFYKLEKMGISIVFLFNYYPAYENCTYVKDDNIQGCKLLMQHFFEQGHRSVGGIFHAEDMQGLERYQGFMEAYREAGLPLPVENLAWYRNEDLKNILAKQGIDALFDRFMPKLQNCSAILCYNDFIAYQLIHYLKKKGYRLPEDYSIASFDNTYLSSTHILDLTSLYHKSKEISTQACRQLLHKIKGLPVENKTIPWQLSIQESTLASEKPTGSRN